MKNKILLSIGLILLLSSNLISKGEEITKDKHSPQGSISIFSSADMYELTTKWVTEYCLVNPGVKINVIKSTNPKKDNFSASGANLGIISNEYFSNIKSESVWKMAVGRDIILPVINNKNPYLKEIYQKGISSNALAEICSNSAKISWGTLLKNGSNEPVHLSILSDESVKSSIAAFTKLDLVVINKIASESGSDLIKRIQNDPYAIGFCKVNNIIGASGQDLVDNIQFLPIDKNSNGKLDYMEGIYDDLFEFLRAAWIGKYPKELSRNIFSISSGKPTNEIELGFIKWVLNDGQKFLIPYGYSDLVYSERQTQLANLIVPAVASRPLKDPYALPKLAIAILIGFVVLLFILDVIGRKFRTGKLTVAKAGTIFPTPFYENSVIAPKGLYFDKTHTWAFMEKDGSVKLGIDDFMQHITGKLTHIKMKNPGDKIKKGEQLFSVIQKGKQLSFYAPVSGTIIAHNNQLIAETSKLNSAPYTDGWIYQIEPSNWIREIQFLFMADIYTEWIKKEFSRLKDFLAFAVKSQKVEYAQIILQDGGDLKDGVLQDLGPEIWEDFQTSFIDSFK